MVDGRWNHNIHYHRLVLREIPPGAQRALDVGCGEGLLARELAERVPRVVGIDADARQIELARAAGGGAEYVHDDFLAHEFGERFDLVASIAAIHHMDDAAALRKMAGLLRPGGHLVVVSVAKRYLKRDLPWELAGAVVTRALQLRHGLWQHSAPIAEPALTHRDVRRLASAQLPGVRFRRLVLWRYSLVWTAPAA